jgi:hypothetical protein
MGSNRRYPSRDPERPAHPIVDWHPSRIAKPVEWHMHNGWPPQPIAVIRQLERQNGNRVEIFYRAVTWAPSSDGRELIGYYKTGDEAAQAAWDHRRGDHRLCGH